MDTSLEEAAREARIANEREFHNARFSEETREAQGKYYSSIAAGTRAFERRVKELARGSDVLEYGCGAAIQGMQVAAIANTLTGIDISDVAIEDAQKAAAQRGLTNTHYLTMDAEDMTFDEGSFDLVFGRGIIHHLDLDRCFASIARVLRPGGTAIFWEPLGHNPLINLYRDRTPEARTPDEHPLLKSDFALAEKYFELGSSRFYGLSTLAAVPMRDTGFGTVMMKIAGGLDQALFKTPMRWMAWHTMMELKKK
ncbi:class I SAM-dependent methyltransferase [Altererythrobacter sp. GH1-8]|uniref:class I SAM-dependent methyltransferase n=1 Tax=Altererythrobacter sp. GH1-8 TaxID=3349333 RepID=UPI00374CB000